MKNAGYYGRTRSKHLYRSYGCDWDLIENIINPLLGGTWWRVLGVSPIASAAEVKEAHRRLAKEWHPDVNPSPLARKDGYYQPCS